MVTIQLSVIVINVSISSVITRIYYSEFYIHGSVHNNSVLIRSNKIQQYASIYLLQNLSLHVSGIHCTHHQENIKL